MELQCGDNQLVELPDELCQCTMLRILNLSENELHALPKKIGVLQGELIYIIVYFMLWYNSILR